jgi:hypothetical protein
VSVCFLENTINDFLTIIGGERLFLENIINDFLKIIGGKRLFLENTVTVYFEFEIVHKLHFLKNHGR